MNWHKEKKSLCIVGLLLLLAPIYGEMLLTPEEKNALDTALAISRKKKPKLYLGGIIFVSSDRWVIWLNDQAIDQDSIENISDYQIINVYPEKIIFKNGKNTIKLQVDHTFLPDQNKIVSGDQR